MKVKAILNKSTVGQFAIFVIGGGASTIIDLTVVISLIYIAVADLLAVTIGFLAGLVVNYFYHARVTFKSKTSFRTVLKYLVVIFVNYFLTIFVVMLARDFLGFEIIFGKLLSLPIVAINGYFLARFWIFNSKVSS